MAVKVGLILLLCASALAQGWGRREAMRPWLQGRFSEAEQKFTQMSRVVPTASDIPMRPAVSSVPVLLLWRAEFEIERARFGPAAALIREVQKAGTSDTLGLPERRLARLYLSIGRFAEAKKLAMEQLRWDGRDIAKLKVASAMDLVTLGEIALHRGDTGMAISILEKARDKAKNASEVYGDEWIRAQIDIALAEISLGSIQSAAEVAAVTRLAAQRQWGANSIPAMDALDTLGLVQLAQSCFKNAEESLTFSRSWRQAVYQAAHPKIAASYLHAALLSAAQGRMDDAGMVQRGLEIEKTVGIAPNGAWALALLAGAEIYAKAGKTGDATSCYASAIPILERQLGADAPRLEQARKRYASLLAK